MPTNWVIKNSDWGPCPSSGPLGQAGRCETSAPSSGPIELIGAQNIRFINNTVHDYDTVTTRAPHDHFECVRTDGGNYSFRRNRFWGCEIYAINITNWHGVNYIENNWFGGADWHNASPSGMAITADPTIPGQIIIRFNSFSAQDAITSDTGNSHAGYQIIGNLIGSSPAFGTQCFSNAVYKYNIYVAGKCGDATNVGNRPLRYVNRARGPNMNYHLASGRWLADNYVPRSQPNSDLATDFDGKARRAPRDAGSDGRLVVSTAAVRSVHLTATGSPHKHEERTECPVLGCCLGS